eukprot:tig00021521_g22062.t1
MESQGRLLWSEILRARPRRRRRYACSPSEGEEFGFACIQFPKVVAQRPPVSSGIKRLLACSRSEVSSSAVSILRMPLFSKLQAGSSGHADPEGPTTLPLTESIDWRCELEDALPGGLGKALVRVVAVLIQAMSRAETKIVVSTMMLMIFMPIQTFLVISLMHQMGML